jgi:branched-chain amino acid transport system ATP-binding protein
MTTAALEVVDATVRFGSVAAVAGVTLTVPPAAIVGLVGPNGAGKSTLLDAIGGLAKLSAGTVCLHGVDVTCLPPHRRARLGLARTFQTLGLFEDLTADENVAVAREAVGGGPVRQRRGREEADRLPAALSFGARKELALDRALAASPRVLLLDEPAAGLDASGRTALARRLREVAAGGTALLVADHDLDLVLELSQEVWVMDFGRIIAHGPPAEVRADPAVASAYLGRPADPPHAHPARFRSGAAVGDLLADARALQVAYDGVPALRGVDVSVHAGEVVALLGPNGAGKTTTLRALAGVVPIAGGATTVLGRPPRTARARAGPYRLARRGLAFVPQDRAVLPSLTVRENLRLAAAGASRADRRAASAEAMETFPALVPLSERRAGLLSGGEQQLLALARAVARRPRVLLVDELTMGLAPRAAREALTAIVGLTRSGCGVLLAEQHPGLALEVADRAVVLAQGRTVFDGGAADLLASPEVLRAAYLGR